jgi:DNA-binding NtrC family response regulator
MEAIMNVGTRRDSPSLARDLELLRTVGTDACVLISTEGHDEAETLARRIHTERKSPRGRFMAVDCGSPRHVLEDDLFGPLRIGSETSRRTLFLKDVGKLRPEHQTLMKNLLLDATVAAWPAPAPVRVIASTTESLIDRVEDGTFEDTLFYRLNMIHLDLRRE